MFKHRLTKFGIPSLVVMLMLFVGGSLQSCKDWLDEYPYDDAGDPEWLGASIYDFLKEGTSGHSYNNIIAIIDTLGEKERLAHTGSNTLFVADDAAFERFFRNENNINPWGVGSVGEMSKAQMKQILYGSMLENAMLLDMLASSGTGVNDEGTCLRRRSSVEVIDTVPLVTSETMEYHPGWPTYNKYWDVLRGKERGDIRLAMDGSRSSMVFFLSDYLRTNKIKASDIEFLFKKHGEQVKTFVDGDALLYGNKLVSSGVDAGEFSDDTMTIACKNGYIYRMDNVLVPPSNMADELRKHPDTKIFSHLLDRFCIPVYDDALTKEYNAFYKTNDSIFKLRYFTDAFQSDARLEVTKSNPKEKDERLIFDPGKNDLGLNGSMGQDMAAMFVPNDDVLYEYFANKDSAGHFLIERFAPNAVIEDVNSLIVALDSVPELNIGPFINNLMQTQFSTTVPSMFERIMDDANELMGLRPGHVDECVIANNGVIYILNHVFSPGRYQAVSAPTLVNENMDIMRNVIQQLRYDYYLLAMGANYTLIVPDDNYFVYFDPLSAAAVRGDVENVVDVPTVYRYSYDTKMPNNKTLQLWKRTYKYDPYTYVYSLDSVMTNVACTTSGINFDGTGNFDYNRMDDLMGYLVVVHDDETGVNKNDKYYRTKNFGTLKIDASDPTAIKVQGGEQLERDIYLEVSNINTQKNGVAYCTVPAEKDTVNGLQSSIPTPPTRSIFDNMSAKGKDEHDPYYEFFNLCYPGDNYLSMENDKTGEDPRFGLLKKVFSIGANKTVFADTATRYSIFYTNTFDKQNYARKTIPFFNIYHYTVYVPTNESIKDLYLNKGLPTWDDVVNLSNAGKNKKAASVLRSIINFAKYHFQDNSVYVDYSTTQNGFNEEYNTAVINERTSRFYQLKLQGDGGNTFTVTDQMGNRRTVLTNGVENKDWNVMCRESYYIAEKEAVSAKLNNFASTSYAVMHPIDGVLLNESMFGYDGNFKRFADNGAYVDTMYVDGSGALEINGRNYYLVANNGRHEITGVDGSIEMHKTGFLMKVIDATDSDYDARLTQEKLIVRDSQNVLVTDQGYKIEQVEGKDANNKVYKYYRYVTKEADGGINIIKYSNDGQETLEKVADAVPEEGTDNN